MSVKIQLVSNPGAVPEPAGVIQVKALPRHSVAQSIYLSGRFASPALCSGLGSCGLCKVRYLNAAPAPVAKEYEILAKEELAAGWRLGCKHQYVEDAMLELPEFVRARNIEVSETPLAANAFLAVDLGTTSIHWQLIENGMVIAKGKQVNPQMGAGSDVVARICEAETPGGLKLLSMLVQKELQGIVASLPVRPGSICIAGNTAMTALFLGIAPEGLARAPYSLPLAGDQEYALPGLPPVYIPPMLAPFVGGDVSAGMLAVLKQATPGSFPFLLCDLGTNGEFVLALEPNKFIAASIPLGPAIEGIGLSCGGLAGVGAEGRFVITGFKMTPHGLLADLPLDQASAISGTGYLSLLSILLAYQIISPNGVFGGGSGNNNSPIQLKILENLHTEAKGTSFRIGRLRLTASDVEELLKVKAAYSLAVKQLLAEGGLRATDLKKVFLAGALGEYVNSPDLFNLGFLPQSLEGKIETAGNTSLAGAALMADEKNRLAVRELKKNTQILSLVEQAAFMQKYVAEMRFVY